MYMILALFIAVVFTYIEIAYEEELERSSGLLTIYLQSHSNHLLDLIFEVLDHITAPIFIVASCVVYLSGNRKIGVMGMYAGFLGGAVSGTMKMIILHPRPF